MRKAELSSLILTNQISREHALELLELPPYSIDQMRKDFELVANKLSISKTQLEEYFSMPLKSFRDYPNNYRLISTGERIITKLTKARRGGAF